MRFLRYAFVLAAVLGHGFQAKTCLGQNTLLPIGVRNAHALAYDTGRRRVVLFGGADASKVCSDTWEWDGNRWIQVSVTGPGPRTFPSMTYDSQRRRVVLFGGNRVLFGRSPEENIYLDDTWEWDGRRWMEIKVPGPPPRAEAVMTFDKERGRSVLFGGHSRSEKWRNWLGDTWEWDGRKWVPMSVSGPSPRNGAAAVYDSARRKIVLFGGSTQAVVSRETWEWDGRLWMENSSAVTQGRFNCVMAYDEARARVIRFGGRYGGKPFGDTWEYDGKAWKQLSATGPLRETTLLWSTTRNVSGSSCSAGTMGRMYLVTHGCGMERNGKNKIRLPVKDVLRMVIRVGN